MMEYLAFFAVTIAIFLFMEIVTWCTHRYVMHGFLWYLHEDHHQPRYNGIFEKNDLFFERRRSMQFFKKMWFVNAFEMQLTPPKEVGLQTRIEFASQYFC